MINISILSPRTITYRLVKNNIKRLIERPLSLIQGIGVTLFLGIRTYLPTIYIPFHIRGRPLKSISMITVHAYRFIERRLRIRLMSQIVGPVGMYGMIGLILIVNLLKDINFATRRPTVMLILWHQPKSRKVSGMRIGQNTCLDFSVLKAELPRTLDTSCNHRYVVSCLIGIRNGTCHKLAVFHVNHLFTIRKPAVPG